MTKNYTVVFLVVILTVFFIASANREKISSVTYKRPADIIGCAAADDVIIQAGTDGKFISILPGWGNHAYTISTYNDSAQIYFNQGLTMYYSYHAREAVASFKEAAKFDSTSAIIWWAQALALGPSYNYGYAYKQHKSIPLVVANMNRYAATASGREKDLIDAMNTRYKVSDTSDSQRNKLNEDYAAAMQSLVTKYSDDIDIKALYIDAVMLIHAWNFWNNDGTAKSWTNELTQYCTDILQTDPHHPAALHYYIHVTEASRNPAVALFCADSLKKLFPGIAHMVHMSSHEYERIGFYALGVDANEKADASLMLYDSLAKGLFTVAHSSHYYAVDAYCALSGAMYKKAVMKTLACRQSVKPTSETTYEQYLYMFPQLAMVRLGKWNDILNDTAYIPNDWVYAAVINDFTKGMAYAKTGNMLKANKNLTRLRSDMNNKILKENFSPVKSSPFECAVIAAYILQANIFFEQKKYDAAINVIHKGIAAEDKLIYAEPKLWMLPARQYLGAFLMRLKKPQEAEKVYREDLIWNPGNGWSLIGLYQSLRAQNKYTEAEKLKPQYMNSFSHADVLPVASAY